MPRPPAAADDVTVLIATRGPSPYFAHALASALAEQPAEVLVVEDGTSDVDVDDSRVRLLRLGHVGRSAARNAGVEAAETPFVALLDDDDLVLPLRLGRHVESLRAAPGSPLSFGRVRVVDRDGHPLRVWNDRLARRYGRLEGRAVGVVEILASRCPIYTSATMVQREIFVAAGGYDVALDAYEDLDLYLRLAREGPLVQCAGAPVAEYRLHGANTPSERLYEGALAVTEKHLDGAKGRARRLLLEWRVDALWGLRRYRDVRREALGALARSPLVLAQPRFAKRLAGAALPVRVLEARH